LYVLRSGIILLIHPQNESSTPTVYIRPLVLKMNLMSKTLERFLHKIGPTVRLNGLTRF